MDSHIPSTSCPWTRVFTVPEEWRQISDWPGYEVSSLGRVRFEGTVRTLTQKANGYTVVGLWCRETRAGKTARVNVLVCHAFHPETYFKGAYACHKNHIRHDNREVNLYWGTQAQNMGDMVKAGREVRPSAKLDWDRVREIRRLHAEEGISGRQLGIRFKVNTQTINCLLRGETWKE